RTGPGPLREPGVVLALGQDDADAGVRVVVVAERPRQSERAGSRGDLVRHDDVGPLSQRGFETELAVPRREKPKLGPRSTLDAADRQSHQLARGDVGRNEEDVHAPNLTRAPGRGRARCSAKRPRLPFPSAWRGPTMTSDIY